MKIANEFENVAEFKYLGMGVTNKKKLHSQRN
jgi:hypothetical protein